MRYVELLWSMFIEHNFFCSFFVLTYELFFDGVENRKYHHEHCILGMVINGIHKSHGSMHLSHLLAATTPNHIVSFPRFSVWMKKWCESHLRFI